MRPEEKIEKKFVEECKKIGIKTLKLEKAEKGACDRIVFIPGPFTLFFEFKVPGGKTSPHQEEFIHRRKSEGYRAEVVDSWEYPLQVVKRIIEFNR